MKIAAIADLHGTLPPIPECDLLIVAGDITGGNPHGPRDNSDDRWLGWVECDLMNWLDGAAAVVMIAGNHDTVMEVMPPSHSWCLSLNQSYLCDQMAAFDGLRIWGTPWTRIFGNLAFELPEFDLAMKWAMIPEGIDILICHQPPYGYGDAGLGSPSLTAAIQRIKPKLVVCGHIHEGRGVYQLGETKIVNCACGFMEVEL